MTFGLVYMVYATVVDPKKGSLGTITPIAIGFIVSANITSATPSQGVHEPRLLRPASLAGVAVDEIRTHGVTASSCDGGWSLQGMNSYAPGAGYGMSLGLLAGCLWKLHHWSNQHRTREFYSLLDEGRIIVVVDEPAGAKD
ncbi:hypothetical protein ZWY2020_005721 [Hordeum vulgare]|nr:hypothetical protein ZWY2020_005721 [Hordeum vulgare]